MNATPGTPGPDTAASGEHSAPSAGTNGPVPSPGNYEGHASVDRDALYEDASFYLGKVFSAVRERKRFALDPGFRILRQVASSYLPQDTLFIKTIRIDDRLNYLINKCVNVAIYSIRLAEQLGYPGEKKVEIGMAGLLHEVGMCLIPEKILYKKEQLTRKEFEIIQQHSEFGYKILEPYSEDYPYLAEVALQVHERIDGSGYPQGLTGEEINEYAQIIGLVDIYEALSHSRPQRDRFNHFYAIKEIIKTCKSKFQKKHLKALLNAFSIFPLSTTVRLNSNAVGRVIETYTDQPMRPKLQIEYDSQGRKVLTDRIVNLPDNPLLYIVDSVSEEEIEQLDHGLPFTKRRDSFEERDFEPPSEKDSAHEAEAPETPAPSQAAGSARRPRTGGGRPLLGLLLLMLFLGGIPFWGNSVRLGLSSPNNASQKDLSETKAATVERERGAIPPAAENNAKPSVFPVSPEMGDLGDQQAAQDKFSVQQAGVPAPKKTASSGIGEPVAATASLSRQVPRAPGRQSAEGDTNGIFARTEKRDGQKSERALGSEPSSSGRRPYSLLLSSFRSRQLTEHALAIYRGKGLDPYFVKVDLGKDGVWYRVFCGQYATGEAAAAAAKMLPVQEAVVKNTRYANRVGSDLSDSQVAAKAQHLEKLGFLPYTIRTGAGQADLFVGAFLTRKGAEDKYAELLALGVENRIVQR